MKLIDGLGMLATTLACTLRAKEGMTGSLDQRGDVPDSGRGHPGMIRREQDGWRRNVLSPASRLFSGD